MKPWPHRAKVIKLHEARPKRPPIVIDLHRLDMQLGAFLEGFQRRLDPQTFARVLAAANAVLDELGAPSFVNEDDDANISQTRRI